MTALHLPAKCPPARRSSSATWHVRVERRLAARTVALYSLDLES
jgi:hypothetical protein